MKLGKPRRRETSNQNQGNYLVNFQRKNSACWLRLDEMESSRRCCLSRCPYKMQIPTTAEKLRGLVCLGNYENYLCDSRFIPVINKWMTSLNAAWHDFLVSSVPFVLFCFKLTACHSSTKNKPFIFTAFKAVAICISLKC